MANLTAQQVTDLANNFSSVVDSFDDFIVHPPSGVTPTQQLSDLRDSIARTAGDLYAVSTVLVMDDVDTSLQQIKAITDDMSKTLSTVSNIQKGIDIATSVVNLGSAVLSRDPGTIATAVKGLADTVGT